LGVSCEDQRTADQRIPLLLETPAAVRFLSVEPLLEPVDLGIWLNFKANGRGDVAPEHDVLGYDRPGIGWVIVGGESGAGARSMDLEWVRSLRDQCTAAGVPFFFKQVGGRTPKAGGRMLDGRTWDEMPAGSLSHA
jgi:protein gp37